MHIDKRTGEMVVVVKERKDHYKRTEGLIVAHSKENYRGMCVIHPILGMPSANTSRSDLLCFYPISNDMSWVDSQHIQNINI